MNSKLTKLVLVLTAAFITSIAAQAITIPGWERPIERADLEEFDGQGREIGIGLDKSLTMLRRDRSRYATSLIFNEDQRVYCVTYPCPPLRNSSVFKLRRPVPTECGSTKYVGFERTFRPGRLLPRLAKKIELVDHRTRYCRDYKRNLWEVTITDYDRRLTRWFGGNPEPVYSIQ